VKLFRSQTEKLCVITANQERGMGPIDMFIKLKIGTYVEGKLI
jgi:hypothetical protein